MFGKVQQLDDIEDVTPLEDFSTTGKSPMPEFGSLVLVRGVLETKPKMIGNFGFGTLLVRDEPQRAASPLSVLKIDIISYDENEKLRPHTIRNLLDKLKKGTKMAIKGRVDVLKDTDLVETSPYPEPLRFKIVIDSDHHSIAYVEKNTPVFKRQISQPQWLHNFKVGEFVENAVDRVFLDSKDIDNIKGIDEVMKYVVAYKNCLHGNILVGVKYDSENNMGQVTGLDWDESKIANWREKLSIAIGSILPAPGEAAAICSTKEEVLDLYEQKSFILVMSISGSNRKMVWIHVPKGEARLYVTKASDVHAFIRTGPETKRITDFNELFCRLDSLGSRKIEPMSDDELDVNKQYTELKARNDGLQSKYQILKQLDQDNKEFGYESQEQEFKMIFADDPVKKIQAKHLTHYSCGFLNSVGDVYGLVTPKWALVIDFDQHPKHEGHLCERFNQYNDIHQMERRHSIKTPQNSKLDLNPDSGITWLAARGYDEIEKSLSTQSHGGWNMTHRDQLRSLLKTDLASSIKPNYLHIIVLWDEGHEEIGDSLRVILEDILSINGKRSSVTIVCCTSEAQRYIMENLVKPLGKSYGEIIMGERVYVAPPYVLARHLSSKLPDPYKPENDFQVPHKKEYRGKTQVFPRILPKHLRQNVNGYLKMMYIRQGRKPETSTAGERAKFYSGSKITFSGLSENFGIQRTKIEELEASFKILVNDRKSHVSMISVKVERGAGSTTMCLQFLFKHHEEYPCAQLTDFGDRLISYMKDIYRETKLPLGGS